jgi:hypothetical protein
LLAACREYGADIQCSAQQVAELLYAGCRKLWCERMVVQIMGSLLPDCIRHSFFAAALSLYVFWGMFSVFQENLSICLISS